MSTDHRSRINRLQVIYQATCATCRDWQDLTIVMSDDALEHPAQCPDCGRTVQVMQFTERPDGPQ